MKMSPPKQITFWVAVVVAVIGLVLGLGVLGDSYKDWGLWVELIGFVILAAGNLLEGF
jgi:hypothetical protein